MLMAKARPAIKSVQGDAAVVGTQQLAIEAVEVVGQTVDGGDVPSRNSAVLRVNR